MLTVAIKLGVTGVRASYVRVPRKMNLLSPLNGLLAACGQVFTGSLSGLRYFFNGRSLLNKPRKDKFTVSIEGNIGSGKTELLKYFMTDKNVEVLMEPVNKWRNIDGHNGLALMYTDPSRWALTFQTYVQLTMLQTHEAPCDKPVKLMERSIYSAKYCFVENLHMSGKMPDVEYIVLTKWFDWIVANGSVDLDLIVYLRTQPETAQERIRQRCRREEKTIPLEYLQQLHELHEDWLIRQTKFTLPCPVLVLDADEDLALMKTRFDAHKKEILCGYG